MAPSDLDDTKRRVVEEFVARYRREQDFYEHAARLVAQTLESRLQAEGIRAIVTYRAKAVSRLEPKVLDRAKRKNYQVVHDVYEDIVDLAGVRIALYFPGQRGQAGRLIQELFGDIEQKEFPGEVSPKYSKRFSGYWASQCTRASRDCTSGSSESGKPICKACGCQLSTPTLRYGARKIQRAGCFSR